MSMNFGIKYGEVLSTVSSDRYITQFDNNCYMKCCQQAACAVQCHNLPSNIMSILSQTHDIDGRSTGS